jgi:hypothetical protein
MWYISSSQGILTNYGYNITYPNGNQSFYGNLAYGENSLKSFNITMGRYNDSVRIFQYYTTSSGITNNFTYVYNFEGVPSSNYTFTSMRDNNYGLGDFEKIILVVLITIIFAGVSSLIGGELIGIAIGIIIIGFFVFTGFISFWMVGIPIVIGAVILIMRGTGNG